MSQTLTTDPLLNSLLHSPRFVEYVDTLREFVAAEIARRERFYDEVTDAEKVEFITGEAIVHLPSQDAHLTTRDNIQTLLRCYVLRHELGSVHDEKCLCVFPRNDYEPDVVFFGLENSAGIQPQTMKFPIPDFVVEVLSDSTEHRDRGVKFADFEAHGVAEYWIVDADQKVVEQYLLQDGHYVLTTKSGSGEITSSVVPGFCIPIRAMFNERDNLQTLHTLMTSPVDSMR